MLYKILYKIRNLASERIMRVRKDLTTDIRTFFSCVCYNYIIDIIIFTQKIFTKK